jgi:hypothetical protein
MVPYAVYIHTIMHDRQYVSGADGGARIRSHTMAQEKAKRQLAIVL